MSWASFCLSSKPAWSAPIATRIGGLSPKRSHSPLLPLDRVPCHQGQCPPELYAVGGPAGKLQVLRACLQVAPSGGSEEYLTREADHLRFLNEWPALEHVLQVVGYVLWRLGNRPWEHSVVGQRDLQTMRRPQLVGGSH